MKIAKTSIKKKGHYKIKINYTICECENCKKRFNLRTSFFDSFTKRGLVVGRFCCRKCRKLFYTKQNCIVENCSKKSLSKKYCAKHYRAYKLYGDPLKNAGSYVCNICKKIKQNRSKSKFKNNICGGCISVYLRELVFKKLGSKCECCKEKIIDFLQLDHVSEGGASERRLLKSKNQIYLRALDNLEEYRLLCANCNWGIYVNKGICPHQIIKK